MKTLLLVIVTSLVSIILSLAFSGDALTLGIVGFWGMFISIQVNSLRETLGLHAAAMTQLIRSENVLIDVLTTYVSKEAE